MALLSSGLWICVDCMKQNHWQHCDLVKPEPADRRHLLLPSIIASELEQVAADAIRTAFHPTSPGCAGLIDRFLPDPEQLLKGPYVSVALPFTRAVAATGFR